MSTLPNSGATQRASSGAAVRQRRHGRSSSRARACRLSSRPLVPRNLRCGSPATARQFVSQGRAQISKPPLCRRRFEAAACGVAIVSDEWAGLDTFFEPGVEILVARDTDDVIAAMQLSDAE